MCGGRNAVVPGRCRCEECNEKHNHRQRERRARLKAEQVCARCGATLDGDGTMCADCREYMHGIREKYRDQERAKRERRILTGMCTRCGSTWAEPGRTMCRKCLDAHARFTCTEGQRVKKYERRQARRDAGLCIDCGAPSGGSSRCQRCSEMRKDSARKYRILQRIKKEADKARGRAMG